MNFKNKTNDSNSLNKAFYYELLYLLGLTEVKEGNKKLIQREKIAKRNQGSLLENALNQIKTLDKLDQLENLEVLEKYGKNEEDQLFNLGLQLIITWINRILFLKLLEAQLIRYHQGDLTYSFLNLTKIKSYDDLNCLFFQVLAWKIEERSATILKKWGNIPSLNSSLFEVTEIEKQTIVISNLISENLPIFKYSVLKDSQGKKLEGKLNSLEYLFNFLDSYDFGESPEGAIISRKGAKTQSLEGVKKENKSLINASVLGLIFEKINGYQDGSFFTPSFITMYMCRETIRRSIIQKFNDLKGWKCQSFNDLHNKIEDKIEANKIINSLKICDPAVGSGHFLVSALNEIIAIKSELKILMDSEGKLLRDYEITVENDELIIINNDGDFFEYNPNNKESQRVQKTLFHEKKTIIENCLFGVDINSNSVKICRLRLWIELLKNSYYHDNQIPDFLEKSGIDRQLETLPNIDINIKHGNSLISRFALNSDLKIEIEDIERSKLYQNAFEWRFEFPQVLNNQGDFIGFDIIIGNPPYLRQEEFSAIKSILKQHFSIYNSMADLLTYFVELGYNLLNKNGIFQFIISNKFTRANYGKQMRLFLLENTQLTHFIDFNGLAIFDEATVDASILGFVKQKSTNNHLLYANFDKNNFNSNAFTESLLKIKQDFQQNNLSENSWSFEKDQVLQIKQKIEDQGVSLKDWNINIYRGILTGFNEAFIIDGKKRQELITKDAKSETIIKPLLRGRDINKYYPNYQDLWLINFHNGYTKNHQNIPYLKAEDYPAIKEYLDQFLPQLKKRTDQGKTPYNLRNCAYLEEFEKPKIIYANMTQFFPFIFDTNKLYTNQKCYILTGKFLEYLTAFFNSKLWLFCFKDNFPRLGKNGRELSKVFFEQIPVKQITEKQEKPFIKLVNEIIKIKKNDPDADISKLEREIDLLVYKLYELTEKEIKMIE